MQKIYISWDSISDIVNIKNMLNSSWYMWEKYVLMNDKLHKELKQYTFLIEEELLLKHKLNSIVWIEVL